MRDFAYDKRGSVDDKVYGGGKRVIIRVDVIEKALKKLKIQNSNLKITIQNSKLSKKEKRKIILTSPKGKIFNQDKAVEYSKLDKLIIICGHYEGIDERVKNFIDEEVSLGDFVMTAKKIKV